MGDKIVIGPINRGLRTDREPFVIDNDSFPNLVNAYQWRGRVKRKRGTSTLGHLRRDIIAAVLGNAGASPWTFNIFTLLGVHTLQPNAAIIPGTVVINLPGVATFTDNGQGLLVGSASPISNHGIINYATGAITITYIGSVTNPVAADISYYPNNPVMGLEDVILSFSEFPGTIAFDTNYSYTISTSHPYPITDVTFYANPVDGTYSGYTAKTTPTPFHWNGQSYQQFWTTNYLSGFWATNGIYVPFSTGSNTIGMQFAPASTISSVSVTGTPPGPPSTIQMTITNCPLVIGDFVFFNEWTSSTPANADNLNFQTGYVTACSPNTAPYATKTLTVTLPNATIASDTYTPGILQYLTNSSSPLLDCLRFYGTIGGNTGWVNFCPPLSQGVYSIDDETAQQYYLVGARVILPFRDRLLFFGPVIQTSNPSNNPIYLQDTVIYSQNGTPYYTASYTPTSNFPNMLFPPILVPDDETASPVAFWEDQNGFGGFKSAGVQQAITTVGANEDSLIVGFNNSLQTRFLFTGNDLDPFEFFIVNSELGSSSTFSAIVMDEGVITRGPRGFIMTSQTSSQRIDLDILNLAFQIQNTFNGSERFCAQRDFINEWIYFTYNADTSINVFPNQTLQYNYRDNSWAIFNECYTTYGSFRKQTGYTWETVGEIYPTWDDWNTPWESGASQLLQPKVIAGNQQGFILERDEGTGEGESLYINSISGSTITSPNHCLSNGDYIVINGCTAFAGSVSSSLNGKIFQVYNATANTFKINPSIISGTYYGGGLITRLYVPFIQTREFPVAWGLGRKTRIGVQQYLLSSTDNGQITLNIYLSQDTSTPYNAGPIVPDPNSQNEGLIYSTILYTCPESTNLGLTPANTNLQMPTAFTQSQIWHRVNTSLIGDTVQFGLTLSDAQMSTLSPTGQAFSITGATKAYPCVLSCVNTFANGTLVAITGISGMTQLNNNTYQVITGNGATLTIDVDSTSFGTYVSGGLASGVSIVNQTDEIEFHGAILDVSPSQMLS